MQHWVLLTTADGHKWNICGDCVGRTLRDRTQWAIMASPSLYLMAVCLTLIFRSFHIRNFVYSSLWSMDGSLCSQSLPYHRHVVLSLISDKKGGTTFCHHIDLHLSTEPSAHLEVLSHNNNLFLRVLWQYKWCLEYGTQDPLCGQWYLFWRATALLRQDNLVEVDTLHSCP